MSASSRRPPVRILRLLAFLGAGFLIAFGLYVGLPWALYQTGIGSGYRVGTLRSGSSAYRVPFNVIPDALRERTQTLRWRRVGWVFAREGELFRIDAEAEPRIGGITLALRGVIGGGVDPVWRHRFDTTEAVRDSVAVPDTGLYLLRFSFTDFVGGARVRWRLEAAPGPSQGPSASRRSRFNSSVTPSSSAHFPR